MKRLRFLSFLVATSLLALAAPAQALDILICNDDGFTSANSRALYQQLVNTGHRVIMTAPVDNQSGRGGYISFLAPIPRIPASYTDPYTGRSVVPRALRTYPDLVGAAGVGNDPVDADISYVNGSPVMACLYGIDVKAPKTFGGAPELVISGPNEGNNLGHINASSGTVNNVYYAINRGLPAIGVSDSVTTSVEYTALSQTSRAYEVASIVRELVEALARNTKKNRARLLPEGVGLNVNIPDFAPGTGALVPYKLTHMGVATGFAPAFYEDLGASPLGAAVGIPAGQGLSGIGLATSGTTLPTGITIPNDASPTSEGNVIAAKAGVSVSVIAGVPEAGEEFVGELRSKLSSLVGCNGFPFALGKRRGCR